VNNLKGTFSNFNFLLIVAIILFAILILLLLIFLIVFIYKKKFKKTSDYVISNQVKTKSKKISAQDLNKNAKNNFFKQKIVQNYSNEKQNNNKKSSMDAKSPIKSISKKGYISVYSELKKLKNKLKKSK